MEKQDDPPLPDISYRLHKAVQEDLNNHREDISRIVLSVSEEVLGALKQEYEAPTVYYAVGASIIEHINGLIDKIRGSYPLKKANHPPHQQ